MRWEQVCAFDESRDFLDFVEDVVRQLSLVVGFVGDGGSVLEDRGVVLGTEH